MAADGALEECSGRSVIALGTQQKINGGTLLVYGTVKVLPLACDLDVNGVATGTPCNAVAPLESQKHGSKTDILLRVVNFFMH